MISLIDWAFENNIQDQPDHCKAEFVLLAVLKGISHPFLSTLTFDSKLYEALAAGLKPDTFTCDIWVPDPTIENYEKDYVDYLHGGDLPTWDNTKPHIVLAHEVMFGTDFGAIKKEDHITTRILEQSIPMIKEISPEPLEWIGEILIAIFCLGGNVDKYPEYTSCINELEDSENITWDNYHRYMVFSILKALTE